MMTLKELLVERQDYDVAMYRLACCLGLVEENNFLKMKGVLNSNNETSSCLYEILEKLVGLGILDENDEGYLWNNSYKGSWGTSLDDSDISNS